MAATRTHKFSGVMIDRIEHDITVTLEQDRLKINLINEYFKEFYCHTTMPMLRRRLQAILSTTEPLNDKFVLSKLSRLLVYQRDPEDRRKKTLKVIDSPRKPRLCRVRSAPKLGDADDGAARGQVIRRIVAPSPKNKKAVRAATVIQARARGMMQRQRDEQHGVSVLEFGTGSLGIRFQDRDNKFGAEILEFVRGDGDEILPAEE